ncbi:MAG: DUF4055 domain-containing protein [Spongiibacteraceae bacterium]
MTATVDTRSDSSKAQLEKLHLVKALMGGTESMRAASKDNKGAEDAYLPQFPKESDEAYIERLARSFLFPAYAEAVCGAVDKVFCKELSVSRKFTDEEIEKYKAANNGDEPDTTASDLAQKIAEDCDREGRDLHNFAADLFEIAVDHGHSLILVDMPVIRSDDDADRTGLDDIADRQYPYFQWLKKENVIAWRVNDAGTLEHIRFEESVTEQDGDWGETTFTQVRVLEPGYWAIYRKGEGKDASYTLFDDGVTTLDMVPIVPVYTKRSGALVSEPPFYELAQKNVEHWQLESDLRNIEHATCFPVWSFLGFDDEKSGERAFGPSIAVQSENPQAKVEVTEPSGSSIAEVKGSIMELKREMELLARKPLTPRTGTQTATEERNRENQSDTPIKRWALALKDALETAFFIAHEWMGETVFTEVMVNTEFQPMHSLEDLTVLSEWEARGSLRLETLLKEAKRRGVLDASVDVQSEIDAIAEAAPTFAGTTPVEDRLSAALER